MLNIIVEEALQYHVDIQVYGYANSAGSFNELSVNNKIYGALEHC